MSDRPEHATAGNSGDPASAEAPSARPAGEAAAAARDYPELSGSSSEPAATGSLDDPSPAAAPLRESGYRGLTVGLAVALVLVVALVGTAPFWSPLLPWSDGRAGVDPAFVERLNAEQQQVRQLEQQIATARARCISAGAARRRSRTETRALSPDLGEFRQQIAAASAGISDLTTRLERLENSAQSQTAGIAELKTGLEQLGTTQQAQTASLSEMTSRLNRTEQAQQAQATSLSDLTARLDQIQKAEQAQAADVAAKLGSLQQGFAGAAIGRGRAAEPFAGSRKDRAIAGRRSDRHGTDAGIAADAQCGRSRAAVSGGIRRFVFTREGDDPKSPPPPPPLAAAAPDRDRQPRRAGAGTARAGAEDRRGIRPRPAPTAAGPARRSTGCAAWSGSAAPTRPSRARRPRRLSRSPSGRSPAAIWRAP